MNNIYSLENQKGIFQVLLLFDSSSKFNLTEIGEKTKLGRMAVRNSVDQLLELHLLEQAPAERFSERKVQLSEKGKKIIPLLKDIDEIIRQN